MTYTDVPKWPGKISGIQGPGKNPEFFFEDRALKIVFLDFSLNSKAISFKTLFCWTNISKKCQLISAVCLLFFKKFVDPILNQQFLKNFKWVSWIYLLKCKIKIPKWWTLAFICGLAQWCSVGNLMSICTIYMCD